MKEKNLENEVKKVFIILFCIILALSLCTFAYATDEESLIDNSVLLENKDTKKSDNQDEVIEDGLKEPNIELIDEKDEVDKNKDNHLNEKKLEINKEESLKNDNFLPKENKKTSKKSLRILGNGTSLDDWSYTLEGNRIKLREYKGTSNDIVVPGEFSGYEGKEVALMIRTADGSYSFPERITSITINDEVHRVKLMNGGNLFNECKNLEKADLKGLDTSESKLMNNMFNGCISLKELNMQFDTHNVIDMSGMFNNCESLKSLDLSSFDTKKVVYMDNMFHLCKSLKTIDLSSFNIENVIQFNEMFACCHSLENLDLSHFKTHKATSSIELFRDCFSLKTLDISHLDTSQITSMDRMFRGCTSLEKLDLRNFDTSHVARMDMLFTNCASLKTLLLGNFDATHVKDLSYLFANCTQLKNIDFIEFKMNENATIYGMFMNCKNLSQSLNIRNNNSRFSAIFTNCSNMHYFDLREFPLNNDDITNLCNAFAIYPSLSDAQKFMELYEDSEDNSDDFSVDTFLKSIKDYKEWFYDENLPNEGVPTLVLVSKSDNPLLKYQDKEIWEKAVLDWYSVSSWDELSEKNKNQAHAYFNYLFLNRKPAGPIYDANGGVFNDGTNEKTYFESIVISDESLLKVSKNDISKKYIPTYEGKKFKGWYLDKECVTEFAGEEIIDLRKNENITLHLYAGWETLEENNQDPIIDEPINKPEERPNKGPEIEDIENKEENNKPDDNSNNQNDVEVKIEPSPNKETNNKKVKTDDKEGKALVFLLSIMFASIINLLLLKRRTMR